jgi:phenylacetate-CoA ligase
MIIDKKLVNVYTYVKLRSLMANFPFIKDKIAAMQLAKLRKLAVNAYKNHEFYRKRFDENGFNPYNINTINDLQKLPILTKEEYRAFTDAEINKNKSTYVGWHFDSTSGSSGVPLRIVRTWRERGYIVAKWLREVYLNGYKCTDRSFRMISPHRLTKKRDSLLQMMGLFRRNTISYLSKENEMFTAYQQTKPDFFYGNKTQIVQLSRYILEKNLSITKPRMYAIGAETIDENSRDLFYRVFGKDNFFETYGCEEMGILGFQIMGTPGLHFSHDTNILELCSEDGRIAENEGACVITDLNIFSFPLIRYQLGDYLETYIDPETNLRKIKKIRGRLNDWFIWKDGTRTDYHFFYEVMAEFSSDISQFRIIQENYDLINILIVLAPNKNNRKPIIETHIINNMKSKMRPEVQYKVEFVSCILPDENGKVRMIISKIKQ